MHNLHLLFVATCFVALNGCASIDTQRLQQTSTGMMNNVANNIITSGGDTAECGISAKIDNLIVGAVTGSKGIAGYATAGGYHQCLFQKRQERQMQEAQNRARQERLEWEARARAPQCDHTLQESTTNGQSFRSVGRNCRESEYVNWRK